MKKLLTIVSTVVLSLTIVGSAFADVTVDPTTGIGFVGKGDVQSALGLNNSQMQAKAGSLSFTLVTADTYNVTEEWTTGGVKTQTTHTVTKTTTNSLTDTIAYNARTHKQVDGFYLTGISSGTTTDGNLPEVGDIVVAPASNNPDPTDHIITAVDHVSSTSGIFVNGVSL
jgi:hypothetical protein